MGKTADVKGADVPIVSLVPLHERKPNQGGYKKIVASVKAVGLIEPLCVHREGDRAVILDGYLRYRACLDLGVETVPCLVLPNKEAYTCNRMVNRLSPVQEARMITQSLGTLDEATIANAFGLSSLKHRIREGLMRKLHPLVIEALDGRRIPMSFAKEMTFVKQERQAEILSEMQKEGDCSAAYMRTLILRTPPPLRNRNGRPNAPWDCRPRQKKELADNLVEAERRHDFYTMLYRQYVTDLLKLCIHVRNVITNPRIESELQARHPEILARFREIVFETEGRKPPAAPPAE
ncbi:MAG: ParB N-terminal domain-containing protein [Planctomycetota bacterium]